MRIVDELKSRVQFSTFNIIIENDIRVLST